MGSIDAGGEIRRLNWKRQPTDLRDLDIHNAFVMKKVLPISGTTTSIAKPDVYDQGQIGSCTQNAGAAAFAFLWLKQSEVKVDPRFSRLFGYYFTRHLEGTPTTEDSGCNVRDVFKAYRRWGICFEKTWPYEDFTKEPSAEAIAEAQRHQAVHFYSCSTVQSMKQSIHDGYPMIFGFDCFESLESQDTAQTGIINLPEPGESTLGGHCMFIDSYDDRTGLFSGDRKSVV